RPGRLAAQGIPALDLARRETPWRYPLGGAAPSGRARTAVLGARPGRPVTGPAGPPPAGPRPGPRPATPRPAMTETQAPVAQRDSPYFGLDYYGEQFGAWFFGRESDGSKIITNLRAARLTLLHAESGVGKTSLLRAGVAWRLHRLADDMFARGRPVRSLPGGFGSWEGEPTTGRGAARDAAGPPRPGGRGAPAP